MCLLNKKYSKYLNENEQKRLMQLEGNYFYLNCFFFSSSALMLIFRPFNRYKIINIYLAFVLLMGNRYNSLFLFKDEVIEYREKVNKEVKFKRKYYDLFDETLITDWRCYLYYYKLL